MEPLVITLIGPGGQSADLEVPGGVPSGVLVPLLAEALGWQDALAVSGVGAPRLLVHSTGLLVRPTESLAAAGVVTGDVLVISPARASAGRCPDRFPKAAVTGPALVSEVGEAFGLGTRTLIGRPNLDRGVRVDIDLARLDTRRRCSRPHALIYEQGERYYLQDVGSKHGTLVNRRPLGTGPHLLKHGDVIQFGRGGVCLQFQHNR